MKKIEEPDYLGAGTPWRSQVGQKLSQRWGFIAERLFIDEADIANSPEQNFGGKLMAGDIKYKDIDKDGEITEADKVPIGYPTTPEITYGFGLSAGYKDGISLPSSKAMHALLFGLILIVYHHSLTQMMMAVHIHKMPY